MFQSEIKDTDMLHCLSGSNLPVIPYLYQNQKKNLIVCDSTGYNFDASGLFMSVFPNKFSSYREIRENHNHKLYTTITHNIIDNYIMTDDFCNNYYKGLDYIINNKQCINS